MGVVVLSTVVFILSTMPELTDEIDMILFTNTTDANAGEPPQPVERWEDVSSVFYIIYNSFCRSHNFQFSGYFGAEHYWPC